MPIIKKNLREFYSPKICFVVIVFSWQAATLFQEGKGTLSFWEFILVAMTDHYYIFYFALPFLAIALYRQLDVESDSILIRIKKFSHYFLIQATSILLITIFYITLHLIIAMLIGIQLRNFQNTFSLMGRWHTELIFLSSYFETPGSALIASIIYTILGLTFINILIFTLNHFFGKKISVASQILAYLLLIIGLHSEIDNVFPVLFLNKYLILHHGLHNSMSSFVFYIKIEIIVLISIYFVFRRFWWKRFNYKKNRLIKGVKGWYIKSLFKKKDLCIIFLVSSIPVLSKIIIKSGLTFPDLIISQFWGHGTGYFSLIEFMNMLVYNGLPIYFLCVFYQNCKDNSNIPVIIRVKNIKSWMNEILKVSVLFLVIYVTMTVVLTISLGIIFNLDLQGFQVMKEVFTVGRFPEPNIYEIILPFILLKTFELTLLYLIIILLDSYLHKVALSYTILLLGHGLCILNLKYIEYIPIGIAFLSRKYSLTTAMSRYEVTLTVLTLSTFITYYVLRYWRIDKVLEEK